MLFITQGKTNLTYLLIVVVLAVIVGGGILGYYYSWIKELEAKLTEIEAKLPEKVTKDEMPESVNEPFLGKWEVLSVEEDSIQIVFEGNGATLEFFEDSTYEALGGCNEMFRHAYEINSDTEISIKAGGTKRGCAKNIVEFWYLNDVYSYKFIDDILLLHYKKSGKEGVFRLRRY